jgi:hypothetical protein
VQKIRYCESAVFLLYTRATRSLDDPLADRAPTMSEKPESDEFDDEEDDGSAVDPDDLDVDHLIADLDKRKKTVVKAGEPAWRRLERIREERETAEQLSDFDDYEIGESDGGMKPKKK